MEKNLMRIVDRSRFIAHVNGDYLVRDADARCLVGDGLDLEQAVKDIEAGLEVGLSVDGRLFSIMYNQDMMRDWLLKQISNRKEQHHGIYQQDYRL